MQQQKLSDSQAAEAAKAKAEADSARADAEKQQAAQAAIGGTPSFSDTRSDQAKRLAASGYGQYGEGGIPGFGNLLPAGDSGLQTSSLQNPQQSAQYAGQGNLLVGTPNFTPAPGGKKYYS